MIGIANPQGFLIQEFSYDAFGKSLNEDRAVFGFTGYQTDSVSNLYFAQARYYDPVIGRFISDDTVKGFLEYPVTLNEYSYCVNEPNDLLDEDGQFLHIIAGVAVGVVVNVTLETVTSISKGKLPSKKKVISSAASGAVEGGMFAATGNSAAASAAGAVTSSVINDVIDGKKVDTIAKNAVANGAEGAVSGWAGGKMTKAVKGTKFFKHIKGNNHWIKKIEQRNISYRSILTRARNAFAKGKILHLTFKTFKNGVLSGIAQGLPPSLIKEKLGYNSLKDDAKKAFDEAFDSIYNSTLNRICGD